MTTTEQTPSRIKTVQTPLKEHVKAGAWAALCRLGRGLAGLPADIVWYLGAHDHDSNVDNAESGDPETRARAFQAQAVRERRLNATVFLGASLAWCTGGWMAFDPSIGVVILFLLTAVTVLSGMAAWSAARSATLAKNNPWAGTIRLAVVLVVSVASEWIHLQAGLPAKVMTAAYLALFFAWCAYAAGDGSGRDNLPGVEVAKEVHTDTRYNRIVEGLTVELKIKPEAEQFRIIGAGLEPVDKTWSRMRVQTPSTITTKQVQDAMPGVASFMGISTERLDAVGVDDGTGREIEGVVDIWLASGDQWKDVPAWPLADAARASVWEPVPFIVTDRGVPVLAHLLFAHWLLVSKARHGKTFAKRLLALVFALDPGADYAAFDFKVGGRDWLWARKTAVASGYGNSDETVKAFLDFLESVLADAERKGALFQALPEDVVPHGQLTREACELQPKLRPLGIFADEVHHALMHPTYGKRIAVALSRIMRELPFLAVQVYIASQRADVRTSIPSEVRNLAANRVAGKLYTSRDSGDVLGDAANDLGYNAKNLRPVKGLFIVHGADDTSSFDGYTRGRAYLVDNVAATRISERAEAARREAGVLPETAGEQEPPPEELLQALEILRASERPSMRSEELASQMGTTPQRLLARIKVRSRQEPTDGYCKHVYLEDLEKAARGEQVGLRVVS